MAKAKKKVATKVAPIKSQEEVQEVQKAPVESNPIEENSATITTAEEESPKDTPPAKPVKQDPPKYDRSFLR
jgi:hypothetical protein